LKRYRLAAGLTHEGLAERARLSARTISDLERGVSQGPRRTTLALLVEALQLSSAQRASLEAAARPGVGPSAGYPDPARIPGNLPVQLTSFVGREREVGKVRRLLRRQDIRLVTLTGPGGIGKTRLAVRVAAEPLDAFPDGVFYVALPAVADRDGATRAIARALGMPDADGQASPSSLVDILGARELLLLLDNFEHLLDAAPLVVELLRGCPRLKVLVTSRAALRVSGEQQFPVPPLAVPDPEHVPPVDLLAGYAATALFVDRATRVRPDFRLTTGNAAAVAAICARLDGLPLALELAAARVKLLSVPALLARLGGVSGGPSLRLLTGGPRDAPPRQRTLRDTIAWSYHLLSAEERHLFRHLAVFAGGCTLAAAEAVCTLTPPVGGTNQAPPPGPVLGTLAASGALARDAPAEEGPASDVLDGLASLVDKSLVYQAEGPDGEPRFMMLETIRGYALEQLAAHGEVAAARKQHAHYYLAQVEATGALLFAAPRHRMRVAAEQDNIQAALRWLVQFS
jgi:predicted ATPase/DNA-binding XRE family transcriptional regulator